MTEAEWKQTTDVERMLEFLRGKVSNRKLGRFAAACCRRIMHMLPDDLICKAVELAEQSVEGVVNEQELTQTARLVQAAWAAATMNLDTAVYWAVREALRSWSEDLPQETAVNRAWLVADQAAIAAFYHKYSRRQPEPVASSDDDERAAQCALLRDLVGNPFSF
jgi:hypothetical protein